MFIDTYIQTHARPKTFNIILALWWETFNFPFAFVSTLSRSIPKDDPKSRRLNPCYVQNYKAFAFIIPALVVHILEAPTEPVIADEALANPPQCNAMLVEYEAIKHICTWKLVSEIPGFMLLLRNTKWFFLQKATFHILQWIYHVFMDLQVEFQVDISFERYKALRIAKDNSLYPAVEFFICDGNLDTHFPN